MRGNISWRAVLVFSMAAAILGLSAGPAGAGTMSASVTAPIIDGADIANYGTVNGNDKWWNDAKASGAAKGQTFTTSSVSVLLDAISYQVTSSQKAEPTKTYVVRIGTVSDSTFSQIYSETFTQDFTWNGGEYMTWTLDSAVALQPNTVYGIDVGMTTSTSAWQTGIPYINVTANVYADGVRYSSGTLGIGTSTLSLVGTSDRIFHLNIAYSSSYWNVDGEGIWDAAAANWNGAADGTGTASAWTPGLTAVFAAGTNGMGSYTVTVADTQDISGLGFTQGAVTLAGGALRMVANAAITVADGLTATVETPITDGGAGLRLIKDGAGTLVLSGANSYTGGTDIRAGTLRMGAGGVIPDSSAVKIAAIEEGQTPTLDLNGNSYTIGSLTLGGATTTSGAAITTGAGTLTLGGNVTYDAASNPLGATISGNVSLGGATRTFTVGNSTSADDDLTVSADISGSGAGLTKAGAGKLVLSGTNTYDGATTVTGGTIQFNSIAALGSTPGINPSAGTTVAAGFDFDQSFLGLMAGDSDAFTVALGANGTQNLDFSDTTGANLPSANLGATAEVTYTGTLTQAGTTYRLGGGGGTLTLPNANALTGGNSLVVSGNVTLAAGNNYSGTTTVNAGTLTVNGTLASQNITVTGGGLNLNTPWSGSTLTVTGGASTLGVTGATVTTADFSAGTGSLDATNALTVTNTMTLPGGASVTTSGPVMQVSGSNIANNASGRTITVSGGTVTMVGVAEAGPLNLSSTGLNIADTTHIKASSYYTNDGRAPWHVSDWTGMTGTFPSATAVSATPANTMWLSNNTTGNGTWISWDLGAVRPISQMHIWNYNEATNGLFDRGVRTLTLETSADGVTWTAVPGLSSTIDWTSIGGDGTISGTVQGNGATSYAGFDWILPSTITTQYLRFNNTTNFKCVTNPANGDKYTGLSEVVFYLSGDISVAVPATNIAATASTTLDLSNAAANHVLGLLTLIGSGTTVTVTNAAGVTFGGINGAADTTLDLGAAEALTFDVPAGRTAEFAGTLAHTGTVSATKTGAGTQILSSSNSYGSMTLSGGALSIAADDNLGNATPLVFDGGTLQITGTALTSYAAGAIGSHAVTQNANKTIGLDIADAGNTFTVSEVLAQGAGGFTKSGAGTLVLTNTNTYSGTTTVSAGTLALSDSGTLGNGASTNGLTMSGGQLDLGGLSQTVGAVSITAAAATGDTIGNGDLAGTTYTASNASGSAIVSANLLGGTSMTMNGAGTLVLSGVNTYTGHTAVNGGGTMLVAKYASMPGVDGDRIWAYAGSTLAVRALEASTDGEWTSANIDLLLGGGGTTSSFASGSKLGIEVTGANTFTYANDIAGTSSDTGNIAKGLVKLGTGTLTLSGVNTYTGNTTVSEGTLNLADTGRLTFVIGAAGMNNKVTGTGEVSFAGEFDFDLTAASTTLGDSWQIVDVNALAETFQSTFQVFSMAIGSFTPDTSGDRWTLAIESDKVYEFSESTGILRVAIYTVLGDTNSDNVVDAADFITLKKNFGAGVGGGKAVGNFDNTGTVNWADLSTLMTNMGAGGDGSPATTPEPATLFVLMAAGLPALLKRRRRRS